MLRNLLKSFIMGLSGQRQRSKRVCTSRVSSLQRIVGLSVVGAWSQLRLHPIPHLPMFSQQGKINIMLLADPSVEPTNKERRNGGRIGGYTSVCLYQCILFCLQVFYLFVLLYIQILFLAFNFRNYHNTVQ